ncbi:hypothetical protein ACFQWG_08075 [Schaalia naturae]|uniref:Uncharacterized protein n=1 Tax=Schaalia naturae TaxID=635203 RepID=A0ABW2SP51_9ACTO
MSTTTEALCSTSRLYTVHEMFEPPSTPAIENPSSPWLVTSTLWPPWRSTHTALRPPWVTSEYLSCCSAVGCSTKARSVDSVPVANASGKLTAPVPVLVVPEAASVTSGLEEVAPKVHPPAGVAPVTSSPVVPSGTTCLTTVTVPAQLCEIISRRTVAAWS